jgi:hypothetical protein
MMIMIAVFAVITAYVLGFARGWHVGVRETEVRWREAVGRKND